MGRQGQPSWSIREEAAIREDSQRRAYTREIDELKKQIEELKIRIKELEDENKQLKAKVRDM